MRLITQHAFAFAALCRVTRCPLWLWLCHWKYGCIWYVRPTICCLSRYVWMLCHVWWSCTVHYTMCTMCTYTMCRWCGVRHQLWSKIGENQLVWEGCQTNQRTTSPGACIYIIHMYIDLLLIMILNQILLYLHTSCCYYPYTYTHVFWWFVYFTLVPVWPHPCGSWFQRCNSHEC